MSIRMFSSVARGKHPLFPRNPLSSILCPLSVSLLFVAGCASSSNTAPKTAATVSAKSQATQSAQISQNTSKNSSTGSNVSTAVNSFDPQIQKAAAKPSAPFEGEGWKPLFDGKSLTGWQVTDFGGHGAVGVQNGLVVAELGDALSGINYTNGNLPTMNYEVALDAMKITGSDFFCGLTFPVGDTHATLILGGWGGAVVGISSIDGEDASENETTKMMRFDNDHWYRVRVRVTENKIQAWLDQEKLVDVNTTGKKISLRFGDIEMSKPLGIATYQTTGVFRDIQVRKLNAQ